MPVKWLTEAELQAQWGTARVNELADRDGNGSADSGAIEAAILEAESRAESKLLTRFAPGDLPTTTGAASATLKRIVGGLALWYLCKLHQIKGEDVRDAQKDALSELSEICQGAASLLLSGNPDVDVSAPSVASVGGLVYDTDNNYPDSATGSATGTFTRDSMRDW